MMLLPVVQPEPGPGGAHKLHRPGVRLDRAAERRRSAGVRPSDPAFICDAELAQARGAGRDRTSRIRRSVWSLDARRRSRPARSSVTAAGVDAARSRSIRGAVWHGHRHDVVVAEAEPNGPPLPSARLDAELMPRRPRSCGPAAASVSLACESPAGSAGHRDRQVAAVGPEVDRTAGRPRSVPVARRERRRRRLEDRRTLPRITTGRPALSRPPTMQSRPWPRR